MSDTFRRREPEPLVALSTPLRVHVVGIGGPGMSPLALLLSRLGHVVTGSDLHNSEVIDQLRDSGISVTIGHSESLVLDVDVVTYSTAIPSSNVELVKARSLNIPVRHRSNLLASLASVHDAIGVAGTHGKTTTTALLMTMLQEAGLDPSCVIGAEIPSMGIGAAKGTGNIFVVEADESDGTLEMLPLTSIVLTNIDEDHLDYFETFDNMRETFSHVAQKTSKFIVLNADDPFSQNLCSELQGDGRLILFGKNPRADIHLQHVSNTADGISLQIQFSGNTYHANLLLRGEHNALNFAAAFAMATAYGVTPEQACTSVKTFTGVSRRFTERGLWNGALLIDDYAHLPAEISAALAATREHPLRTGKVVAVFQPNRFHRIAAMADAYEGAFDQADHVVITDIYASGTPQIEGVTGELVVNAVKNSHPRVEWAPTRKDIVESVATLLQPGDICISMGCGDIETFPDDLMQANS